MSRNPLAEVFGYPVSSFSTEAINHRNGRLCPFHNSAGLNCTKNSAIDPLGVCTVHDGSELAITCPVRFRQDQVIISDAAKFFFPNAKYYVALTEVRMDDKYGKSAGNIDIVLTELDEQGNIVDFGAIEVQAVYISGNVSKAFKHYIADPEARYGMEWPANGYPKPDYLSSSRKRLAPQLIYKGGILHHWHKKMAVVVQKPFFDRLPVMPTTEVVQADIAWMVYDLGLDSISQRYKLEKVSTHYTDFDIALNAITNAEPGNVDDFIGYLQTRIRRGRMAGLPLASEIEPTLEPPVDPDNVM